MALNISSDLVPQVINDYNAYTEDDLLIGLADEVTLPKIKNKTTTVNGMGIAGDVDSPVPGQFESMEATLNWNTMRSHTASTASVCSRYSISSMRRSKRGGASLVPVARHGIGRSIART